MSCTILLMYIDTGRYRQSSENDDDKQHHRGNKPIRQMGYVQLQKLLENDDIEDVILQLNNDRRGFKELLGHTNIKPDIVVLLLKLIAKICSSGFQTTILETILRSNFPDTILNYIAKIPIQVST